MKIILTIFLLFSSNLALSQFDYSIENLVRSYPMGYYSKFTLGYGHKIWSKNNLLYGYIRPSATAQTSIFVNSGAAQIDFAPISFMNFYAGYEYTSRKLDTMPTFDCNQVLCRGNVIRNYWGGKIGLKFGPFLLLSDNRILRTEMKDKQGDFADERATIVARSGYDYITMHQMIFGIELNKEQMIGALFMKNYTKYFTNSSLMSYGVYQHKKSNWIYTFGMGTFETRTDSQVFSVIALVQWNGSNGIKLF